MRKRATSPTLMTSKALPKPPCPYPAARRGSPTPLCPRYAHWRWLLRRTGQLKFGYSSSPQCSYGQCATPVLQGANDDLVDGGRGEYGLPRIRRTIEGGENREASKISVPSLRGRHVRFPNA